MEYGWDMIHDYGELVAVILRAFIEPLRDTFLQLN